jgi:hypothetical protein
MGGLALKDITRRYTWEEFGMVNGVLIPTLERYLNTDILPVKAYRQKDSHGDMDLLVYDNGNLKSIDKIREWITETFHNQDFHRNSNVLSWDYLQKGFDVPIQVDLIFVPPENWPCSKVFYKYNELGNLMGKLFHKFGLSYGYDGLKIKYYYKNNKRLIYVSKDSEEMFKFIGLSWDKFQQGFDTLVEVFDYIIGSPYFNKESFQWENLNSINYKRNKRRPNYQMFLDYLDENDIQNKNYIFTKDKPFYFDRINQAFPEANLYKQMFEFHTEIDRKEIISAKWNGKIIQELYPELIGKKLGDAIIGFKKHLEPDYSSYDKFIFDNDLESIKTTFNEYIKNRKDSR